MATLFSPGLTAGISPVQTVVKVVRLVAAGTITPRPTTGQLWPRTKRNG